MGSPVSGIVTEMFIQNIENPVIKHIIENKTNTLDTSTSFLIYNGKNIWKK
jgi:hypothetical protein